jgi:hypothetical protein
MFFEFYDQDDGIWRHSESSITLDLQNDGPFDMTVKLLPVESAVIEE